MIFLRLACVCILLALSGCASLTTLFFYPQKVWITTPAEFGVAYQDVWLTAQDNTELHAWWLPAQAQKDSDNSDIVALYLHGNAENISSHSMSIYWLSKAGVGVLALDYRGFGASNGQAMLPDVLQDIEAAARWLRTQFPDKKLVIVAQSIGTALALNFTAKAGQTYQIQALVLDAPFARFGATTRHILEANPLGWPILPFTWLLPTHWDPIDQLDVIHTPVLILHSREDKVIAYSLGRKLYQRWQQLHPQQTILWQDSQGPHIHSFAHPHLRQRTLQFLLNATH